MKDFIYELALKFAPTYKASRNEECYLVELEPQKVPRIFRAYPAWRPYVYFSTLQLESQNDLIAYEINYLTIWDRDTGGIFGRVASHQWDTERTAILVTGPKDRRTPDAFSAKEAYYAAHEGVHFVDKSRFCSCILENCGVTVYWSEGKHASYPDDPCRFFKFEKFVSPEFESKPGKYNLIDIGTIDNPKIPWVLYRSKWGLKVGSVYEKLKTCLWSRKKWREIKKPRYTKKDIKRFQEYHDLPITGEVDKNTIKAVYNVGPHLIQSIPKVSKESYQFLRQSRFRGKDIDLIVKKDLPEREIEKIVETDLYGTKLRKYLKDKF